MMLAWEVDILNVWIPSDHDSLIYKSTSLDWKWTSYFKGFKWYKLYENMKG